jgi:hypothetical protein
MHAARQLGVESRRELAGAAVVGREVCRRDPRRRDDERPVIGGRGSSDDDGRAHAKRDSCWPRSGQRGVPEERNVVGFDPRDEVHRDAEDAPGA